MRQENYLIALFNKDLLDLHVPLPPAFKRMLYRSNYDGKGLTLTRVLEWNLRFCLMEYLFNQQGHVRKVFLKNKHRAVLIDGYVCSKISLNTDHWRGLVAYDDALFSWVS